MPSFSCEKKNYANIDEIILHIRLPFTRENNKKWGNIKKSSGASLQKKTNNQKNLTLTSAFSFP
jgi:hypothetical protein